jgi:hypothetical protein
MKNERMMEMMVYLLWLVPSTSNTTTMCDDGPPPTTTTTHQGQVEATVGGGLQERGTSMSKS